MTDSPVGGWTLAAWIDHSEELRALDERLRASERDMELLRDSHAREMASMERRYNQAHFEQLNENAKRTIEERGHFVSKDEFDPFRETVLEYQARRGGSREGGDKLLAVVIAVAGALFGLAGITIAVILAVTGS